VGVRRNCHGGIISFLVVKAKSLMQEARVLLLREENITYGGYLLWFT
jgi:hypothetical protein